MHTAAWPTRMREVFAATAVRKISGALMCEYSMREWCSTAQMPSKPTSSANTACSTQLRIAWRSTSGVPYSTWASKIIENFIAGRYPGAAGPAPAVPARIAPSPKAEGRFSPMTAHPYHDVAITGVFNTEQARVLEGEDSMSISFKGALGALADAGLEIRDLDGVVGQFANDFVYQARLSPVWVTSSWSGIPAILQAASAIAAGMATRVLVLAGTAGVYVDRASTAPWTGRAASSWRP